MRGIEGKEGYEIGKGLRRKKRKND